MATAVKKNGHMLSVMGRPLLGPLSSYPTEIVDLIEQLRSDNEGWGAISILVELEQEYNYVPSDLPSVTAIYNFLRQKGFIKSKLPSHPMPTVGIIKAKYSHQKWEMDAKGTREVTGIDNQALIDIKDVFSRKYCMSFPISVRSRNTQASMIHYQWALRLAFIESGMPKSIQVDKDNVFIDNNTKSPFPKKLHLWLMALGVELSFITKAPPAQNSIIERSHQTFYNQAIKGKTYKCWGDFFACLQKRRKQLNEHYPSRSLGGKAPLQKYPKARQSKWYYSIEKEEQLLDVNRIHAFLAKGKWIRIVGKSNRAVMLGGQSYYISKVAQNRTITITFCNQTKMLLFHNVNEQLVAKHPLKGISVKEIMGSTTKKIEAIYKRLFKAKKFPL